jgi:hypothetical protein
VELIWSKKAFATRFAAAFVVLDLFTAVAFAGNVMHRQQGHTAG